MTEQAEKTEQEQEAQSDVSHVALAEEGGFKVCWQSLLTGAKGESLKPMRYETAKAWRDEMNRKYKGVIHHWVAPWENPA